MLGFMSLLAGIFFVLWLMEHKKTSTQEKVTQIIAEADEFAESKRREALDYYWKKTKSADEREKKAEQNIAKLEDEKASLQAELDIMNRETICVITDVDSYSDMLSSDIKNKLTLVKNEETSLIKSGKAVNVNRADWVAQKIINSQTKQILRCFNSESDSIIGNITIKNVDTARQKLQRSYDALNKVFEVDGVSISLDYYSLKLEELSLVYTYMVKIEEEKEQKKAIREQMAEEEKVRRELEREKQKIEKEENQFNAEVKKLMSYMQKATDDVEKQLYVDKIRELEEKLRVLSKNKEDVLNREENTRAGFVYIISNIGSFGENIYKIGMTRRLDPMERIFELSSASVPFPFDVHALIFSDDAPALETLLHRHFQEQKVNKVNNRKEFFRVSLDEIKTLVLENHNSTVKFIDIPEATEYRETLKLEAEASQKVPV